MKTNKQNSVLSWAKLLSGLFETYPSEREEKFPGRQIIYYSFSIYKKILCTEWFLNEIKLILKPAF